VGGWLAADFETDVADGLLVGEQNKSSKKRNQTSEKKT